MDFPSLMLRAVAEAADTQPHPNPRVGAVVVTPEGEVVGAGAHAGPGESHAEVVALAMAGERAAGATLVVTLEPCAHTGRTPPCVEAIFAAGVDRVVIGVEDPDTRVAGSGIASLRDAGIEVLSGVAGEAARALDPGYFVHRTLGRPRVTLKAALTLDGQVAAADGTSQWITSEEARSDAHRLRSRYDAVMVGSGTVIADDPLLDVRLPGYEGRQPRPVVVQGSRAIPDSARIWSREPLVLATTPRGRGHEHVVRGAGDLVDMVEALTALGSAGIVDLLVEGGPRVARSLWEAGVVDDGVFYVAGAVAGGTGRGVFDGVLATVSDMTAVTFGDVRRVGSDLRVEFTCSPA